MQTLRRPRDLRPLGESEVSSGRRRAFSGILFLLFCPLLARLWYLQVLQGDHFWEEADSNRSRLIRAVAPRGAIEDVQGHVLVTNRAQFTVFVVPLDLPKRERERSAVLARLARILGRPPEELQLSLKRNGGGASDPIPVDEGVSMHVLSRIAENRLRLPGVTAQVEPVRDYPRGKLAAHLLGSIGQVNPDELTRQENLGFGYRPGDFIGKSGVERQYDRYLTGREGGVWFEIDARGRRQRELRVEEPAAGATLRLCLDARVQAAAETAMNGHHGAVVAVDPRNGRVLALASKPAYNPNDFARRPLRASYYQALTDPKNDYPLQNRAVSSPQPPGSTFKVVTAAAGLATGTLSARTTDYCAGGIRMGRRIKKCHSRHGSVDLDTAIAASCDVFFYHAGFRIGPAPLAAWAGYFGLGCKTDIDLPWEKAGIVPSPAWKAAMAPKFGNPDTSWYRGDTANMAIGQGDLQATPLQMALVAAGIANHGVIYKPRVVYKATSADKKTVYQMEPEILQKLPLAAQKLLLVARGMRAAVAGPRGTSHAANLDGVAVAGKSGSAETRSGGPTHAWFICYAPFDKPTIALCVFLEANGQKLHGGKDAAPIARAMMAAYFNVPDRVGVLGGGSLAD